jgi:succinate-semialdehyde dehydrogenase/glutarate-semialdehyde dehydrogenase
MAELASRAGFPPGVFNVITGESGVIAKTLTDDERVRKFSFTGSTEVGRKLLAACAANVKRVSMELGGNAPFIVFDDADLDAAVQGLITSKFRNTGQTCVCANRVFVQAGVYDTFAEKLAAAVAKLKVGNGLEPGVDQGPLIDDDALAKVEEHLADALKKGAKVIQGGGRHELGGTFFQPTVLTGATADMQFMCEETFGPLAALLRFETEAEAIALANDTPYGLAAYFYTRDQARAWRVAESIESGMVGINTGLVSNPAAPFGGVKQSGLGREGSYYGLEEYLEVKYLAWGK